MRDRTIAGSVPLAAVCTFCRRPIDFPSGFFFEIDIARIAHPDCMSYTLERGDVPPGSILIHTCGEAGCVNPAHLTLTPGKGRGA